MLALEAAQRAPALAATLLAQLSPEHERGLGQWQSQWFTLRELFCTAASALAAMAEAAEGLQVDAGAMRANLERTRGLAFSEAVATRLARTLGKARAHALTEQLCHAAVEQGRSLLEAMRSDGEVMSAIPAAELSGLFDPHNSLGAAQAMIERAVEEWRAVEASQPETTP
jgi:3-carboxy-cis,cis-muconate cycloisomerase